MNTPIVMATTAGHDKDYADDGFNDPPEVLEAYEATDTAALDSGEVLMAQILQVTDDEVLEIEDSASIEHDESHIHFVWELVVRTHN
jgi:hypothetical protein